MLIASGPVMPIGSERDSRDTKVKGFLRHASITTGNQLRNAALARFLAEHNRIGPIGGALPSRMRGAWAILSSADLFFPESKKGQS
jgi:hypothetical protein